MRRFRNILFAPLAHDGNAAAARQVVDLASRSNARLLAFGVVREPTRLQRTLLKPRLVDAVQRAERGEMQERMLRWSVPPPGTKVDVLVVSGSPVLAIIERVMVANHDLVVVTSDDDRSVRAAVKRLLRKCPCPVWVIRASDARTQRVLAAVNVDPGEEDLHRTVLELAASMVELYGGELHVAHAWELFGEETLRTSPFVESNGSDVEELLRDERGAHRAALAGLLSASSVADAPWRIHLEKGPPGELVPELVARHRINLLVMGTVARGGIAGLVMGNTAEQVLDLVRCSVIVVKPPWFESPIRPAAS